MLNNPFKPTEIVSDENEFYGRSKEISEIDRGIKQGSIAINGPISIGKSSLLKRINKIMSDKNHQIKLVTGHKDIDSIDKAARLILESFLEIDEQSKKAKFMIPGFFEFEATEAIKQFQDGRHLACLQKILKYEKVKQIFKNKANLIIAIDEVDKCPIPMARLIRTILTQIQHEDINNFKFILAGVSPYFKSMVGEDPGIARFFYKVITLSLMSYEDSNDLIESKIQKVITDAERKKINLELNSEVIQKIVLLSGGHPHILQLLGSHLIEHENSDPDGILDFKDLVDSLRTICYEDRAFVYTEMQNKINLFQQQDNIETLFGIASTSFPTRISKNKAKNNIGEESLLWLLENNIITNVDVNNYGFIDEFFRVRYILDKSSISEKETSLEILKKNMAQRAVAVDTYIDFNRNIHYTDEIERYGYVPDENLDTLEYEEDEFDEEDEFEEE